MNGEKRSLNFLHFLTSFQYFNCQQRYSFGFRCGCRRTTLHKAVYTNGKLHSRKSFRNTECRCNYSIEQYRIKQNTCTMVIGITIALFQRHEMAMTHGLDRVRSKRLWGKFNVYRSFYYFYSKGEGQMAICNLQMINVGGQKVRILSLKTKE